MANKFNANGIALKLLTKIMLDGMEQYIGVLYRNNFENIRSIEDKQINADLFEELGEKAFVNLRYLYTHGYNISSFSRLYDEVRNFASSLLDLIYPPERFVAMRKSYLEYEKQDISKKDSNLRDQAMILKDYDEFKNLMESFQQKWNLRDEFD